MNSLHVVIETHAHSPTDSVRFPNLREAAREQEFRRITRLQGKHVNPLLLDIVVIDSSQSSGVDTISVLSTPRAIASLLFDIHKLNIADAVSLHFDNQQGIEQICRQVSELLRRRDLVAIISPCNHRKVAVEIVVDLVHVPVVEAKPLR